MSRGTGDEISGMCAAVVQVVPAAFDREAAVGKGLPAYGGGRSGKDVPG